MRLTAKSEYGLLAMIDLASAVGGVPLSAREISESQVIPGKFLEQLLATLRKAGLISALRGAKGGFVLEGDAGDVTVLDIVEALEGPLTTSVCEGDRGIVCGKAGACAAAGVWVEATEALKDVFASTPLRDLARVQSEFKRVV